MRFAATNIVVGNGSRLEAPVKLSSRSITTWLIITGPRKALCIFETMWEPIDFGRPFAAFIKFMPFLISTVTSFSNFWRKSGLKTSIGCLCKEWIRGNYLIMNSYIPSMREIASHLKFAMLPLSLPRLVLAFSQLIAYRLWIGFQDSPDATSPDYQFLTPLRRSLLIQKRI